MFDTYASRIIYNRERQGSAPWRSGLAFPHPDEGKRVELLPSSLAMCYLESVRLLEESFNHAEEAVQFGLRCIQVAPTYTPAYRQTARAYMLMGRRVHVLAHAQALPGNRDAARRDRACVLSARVRGMEGGENGARRGVLHEVDDGSPDLPGPMHHRDASADGGDRTGPYRSRGSRRDPGRRRRAIAPLDSLLDALDDAMRTAIDDNIFQVGQPLLALRLFYRPDDALVNVHKSLNAPLPPQALD